MAEKIDLRQFDIIGMITLDDVEGIEKYVTPVIVDGKKVTYLSRSKEYYNVKSMYELALERETLKTKLTTELSKRNFVILENMLNCSAKVYFKKFEQYILSGKSASYRLQLEQARDCLMEDVANILKIFENEGLIEINHRNMLPVGEENAPKRAIEMDNKAMLYVFAKTLKMKKAPSEVEVLTPGYGSLYIGPFLKAMYGYDFTNTLKSKYIDESKNSQGKHISELMSSKRPFEEGKTVLLLDDNIGTGATMKELQQSLKNANVRSIISGAVQYNWRNYFRVTTGEKKDIDRFEVTDFDIVTPFNYAGHKLYKHAVDLLHSSGIEYIEYLNSKSYRVKERCDLAGAVSRALTSADRTGLTLVDGIEVVDPKRDDSIEILDRYKDGPTEITNPISKIVIKLLYDRVSEIDKAQEISTPTNEGVSHD